MLAEELLILNGEGPLWQTVRPLLDAALRLEQLGDTSVWHGWKKSQVNTFLAELPSPCSVLAGIWDTVPATDTYPAQDRLVLGVVCKVEQGAILSISTFESLVAAGLKSVETLEIGMEDALEIMHYARRQVAPVAWALFSEKSAWDEWLFAAGDADGARDKGQLLGELVAQGRCVLMGSQAALHEQK